MKIERTTRFGGFPAIRLGTFYSVFFPDGHWKLSVHHPPKPVETKTGCCKLTALNIGPLLFLREKVIG